MGPLPELFTHRLVQAKPPWLLAHSHHLILFELEAVVGKVVLHCDFFVFCAGAMGTLPYENGLSLFM